ncbi:MAG: lysophospholipid acyltransferase family protein [Planctomycetota bacterium]|nr:lysophospholipid acyltransferase family protein [Planctomycetota bacterium]
MDEPPRGLGKGSRRPRRRFPEWAEPPIYAAVRAGAATINMVGAERSMRLMRGLGGAFAGLPFNRRRLDRAVENIGWCFPRWDRRLVREYAVESYRHLFCLAAEVAVTPRLLSADAYASHMEIGGLGDALRKLAGRGPCVLITGHCGNWELLGYALAVLGFPLHALYRPLDLAPLDEWVHQTRSSRGLTLVDKFGAAHVLPELFERGAPVGFIADQNAGDRGLFVPFFNRLASAYKTVGLLAMRYNASVICGQARRLSGLTQQRGAGPAEPPSELAREAQSFRYRIEVIDMFGPDDWRDQPDPLFYITARYRRAIETMVRRAPEQYLWMHRYWKSRPPHEVRDRPFPAQLREKIAALPWIDADDVEQIVDRSDRDAASLREKARADPGP